MKRLLGAALLVVVLLAGCGTATPDTRGMTVAQATEAVKGAGFKVGKIAYDRKTSSAPGFVVGQTPAGGERAEDGSVVVLTVAGFPPVATPELGGLSKAAAEAALVTAGLILGNVTESYDATVSAGAVVSQAPEAHGDVHRGSAVAVVVSKGPQPVAVPQVKGKTEKDATKSLEAAGFKVKVMKTANAAKKGAVISQKPSGKMALPGVTFTITVSTGVEIIRVPNLLGKDNQGAAAALRRAGLKPELISVHGGGGMVNGAPSDWYEVYRQLPASGSLVPKGTTVRYFVGYELS